MHKECLKILRGSLAIGRRQVFNEDLKVSDSFVMPPSDYQGENEEFYPERWLEKRAGEGEGNKHAFVAATVEDPEFGIGRHACPG